MYRAFKGAIVFFFPFTFKDGDLSRYQYAKHKWLHEDKNWAVLWPWKAQLETLTQCYANSFILACPILLSSMNHVPYVNIFELLGTLMWATAWVFENLADIQKLRFVADCKARAKATTNKEEKENIKESVLGYKPYDSHQYWLWTKCRHPNYFCEWVAWIGFSFIGLGSVVTMQSWTLGGDDVRLTFLLCLTLFLLPRFFYDCLVYWTGSAPAEQRSVQKRPLYKEYQKVTRVFFPFPLHPALVNNHMTANWPWADHSKGD